jgi:hypothetical protein
MSSGGPAVGDGLFELLRCGLVQLRRLLHALICVHSGCF